MAHGCTYCTDDFHCEKFTDEKHTSWCYGKDYPCKDRRISNSDRIRAMTDEELAKLLNGTHGDFLPTGEPLTVSGGYSRWLDWLKQEASE